VGPEERLLAQGSWRARSTGSRSRRRANPAGAVKVRSRAAEAPATLTPAATSASRCASTRPSGRGPGQAAVFYDGDTCLGGAGSSRPFSSSSSRRSSRSSRLRPAPPAPPRPPQQRDAGSPGPRRGSRPPRRWRSGALAQVGQLGVREVRDGRPQLADVDPSTPAWRWASGCRGPAGSPARVRTRGRLFVERARSGRLAPGAGRRPAQRRPANASARSRPRRGPVRTSCGSSPRCPPGAFDRLPQRARARPRRGSARRLPPSPAGKSLKTRAPCADRRWVSPGETSGAAWRRRAAWTRTEGGLSWLPPEHDQGRA